MVAEHVTVEEVELMGNLKAEERDFLKRLILSGAKLDFGKDKTKNKFQGMILDEKYFRRMDKFGGKPELWNEWFFNFSTAIGQVGDKALWDAIEQVVKKDFNNLDVVSMESLVGKDYYDKYSGELFSVLVGLTEGEANSVVRGVCTLTGERCGFTAIKALGERFNPKTPARFLMQLMDILKPGVVKDARGLAKLVEDWEGKISKWEREWEELLSEKVKVALFLTMIPQDFQDVIFQNATSPDFKYKEIRDKVMCVASHRVQMVTPQPMDIGRVGLEEGA